MCTFWQWELVLTFCKITWKCVTRNSKMFFFEPAIITPEDIICKIAVEKISQYLGTGGLSNITYKVQYYK